MPKRICVLLLVQAALLGVIPGRAALIDPPYYHRQSTWQDTMLASLEALAKSELEDGFAPFESDTLRGGDLAQYIRVPVAGAREMYLFVTGCPDVKWAVADWADAKLFRRDGTETSLSRSNAFKALLGRHELNLTLKSGLYQKMRLGDRQFDRGLNVQADSVILVPLEGEYDRFEAWIGVDAWAGTNGNVRFSVVGARSAARKRLFEIVTRDFPQGSQRQQMSWEREDRIFEFDWAPDDWSGLAMRYAKACYRVPPLMEKASELAAGVKNKSGLEQAREQYYLSRRLSLALADARHFDFEGMRQALQDLEINFPDQYPKKFLVRLAELENQLRPALLEVQSKGIAAFEKVARLIGAIETLKRDALLANPLLDFEQLLVLKRQPLGDPRRTSWEGFGHGEYLGIPRQSSWNYGTMPNVEKWTNEIAVLSPVCPTGQLRTLFRPSRTALVNDIDLHWDADKLLFSMPDTNRNWQVFELSLTGTNPIALQNSNISLPLTPTLSPRERETHRPSIGQSGVPGILAARDAIPPLPGGEGWGEGTAMDDNPKPSPVRATVAAEDLHRPLLRQLTPSIHRDVHNYDGIYLPGGEIIFLSTAPLQGVPCNASVIVGMMYKMGANGEHIRQLTFEQDHDYTPSVLNNGRVLYLRWDYTDTPHVWNRLLMSMNPDGTGQMEYYGANSYWPNAIFFARAIPNHETKVAAIVTGHHEGRVGELFIFDPAKGRHETNGVVQRIPRRGPPIEPRIEDKLTEHSWPKFLHPWPLNDKYFLVACKPEPEALWGIYLVDVFDNRVLLKEEEGFALLEPVPLVKRPKPPVIEDKVQPDRKDALVYMEDVYSGPGLRGVPRGTVKNLRLFTYHFGYQTLAGIDHRVGADGPWEAKRVLGTVPVEEDGSALFRVPAKTPISFQPLDAEGKAVALMRSWMSAMPGENVSCVGCHDRQSTAAISPNRRLALTRTPSEILPWRGPVHGFSFARDVQPVLDKFCVGCHDGAQNADANVTENREGSPRVNALDMRSDGQRFSLSARERAGVRGKSSNESSPPQTSPGNRDLLHAFPDLRRDQGGYVVFRGGQLDGQFIRGVSKKDLLGKYGAVFEPSYVALRQYVRVGGLESDLHLLPPKEFHADTSELIRMLQKGHHNVKLDEEAWDRLVTWIDLNAPCHGTWGEVTKLPGNQCQRRLELRRLYGGVVEDCEEAPEAEGAYEMPKPVMPEPLPEVKHEQVSAPGWPLAPAQARQLQAGTSPTTRTIELGHGTKMELVRIPAGSLVMGDSHGEADERPLTVVRIDKPFWMAKHEISNEQFAQFDPSHDSRFEHRSSWMFDEEYIGWPLNRPRQPAVRVSWQEAMAFCRWLGEKIGEGVTLPTEAQWEYACRAGTDTPLSFGDLDTDFSGFGNLGDVNLRRLADEGWRPKSPDLVPRDARFNDGALVTVDVGHYQPNAWGLYDMHGNAAEWTRTTYRSYPYRLDDGRDAGNSEGKKVVRGGSWRDRPKLCRSAYRWAYPAYQKVYNVGFRVIIELDGKALATAGK